HGVSLERAGRAAGLPIHVHVCMQERIEAIDRSQVGQHHVRGAEVAGRSAMGDLNRREPGRRALVQLGVRLIATLPKSIESLGDA
ncbi:MAG TPA: hypothetical protein VIJ30_10145, partial [Candidatus Dormibacteraeota bacterium]